MTDQFEWRHATVDGHRIDYRVGGPVDAPAMVHVHGFAISGNYLMPTARLLNDEFRVYVPDLPGFGRSPRPKEALSIEELGALLARFIREVIGQPCILVGNSLGCAISGELIALAPELVTQAIMVGLAGGPHNRPLVKALGQMARDGLSEPSKLLPVVAPDYVKFGPVRAMKLFSAMTKFPAYQHFMSLQLPVMVVIGSEDPLRPPWRNISREMAHIPPQVRIVLFQGAAHAINFTHPRELAHAIKQYVAGEAIRMDAHNPSGVPVLELMRPVYRDATPAAAAATTA